MLAIELKDFPACRVAPVAVRRVGGPATHWPAAQMAAAGGTARGHHQDVRHTGPAWSPRLAAGCVPARSGSAGTGRGPHPDPAAAPALDHKENRAKRAAEAAARAGGVRLSAVRPVQPKDRRRRHHLDMHQVRADSARMVAAVKAGDEDQRHSARPKPLPLPWVTSPRELPFRTGESM